MSNKNTKKCTSKSIAPFNWCSHLSFFFSPAHGAHKLPNPPPLTHQSPPTAVRLAPLPNYEKRLSDLERDIDRLKARITEKHPDPAERERCPFGEEEKEEEAPGPAVMRFQDRSFLHELTDVGKPWERLCMHVSSPTVAEDATTAAEVLQRMTKIKIEDLCKCLMSLMPMDDITGIKFTGPTCQPSHPETELDFLVESILFASVKKFEDLVLQGLKIQFQMGATSTSTSSSGNYTDATASTRSTASSDWVVLVVLIQVRDPKEGYGSVGELMIGLVEAQLGDNGALQFSIQGVHVAGLSHARNKITGRDFMWSISLKFCGGLDGLGVITRNPDCLFPCSI